MLDFVFVAFVMVSLVTVVMVVMPVVLVPIVLMSPVPIVPAVAATPPEARYQREYAHDDRTWALPSVSVQLFQQRHNYNPWFKGNMFGPQHLARARCVDSATAPQSLRPQWGRPALGD